MRHLDELETLRSDYKKSTKQKHTIKVNHTTFICLDLDIFGERDGTETDLRVQNSLT